MACESHKSLPLIISLVCWMDGWMVDWVVGWLVRINVLVIQLVA